MDFRDDLDSRIATDPEFNRQWNQDEPEREILKTIARLRYEQNMTQEELSERCGIKQGELSKIENGKANPTLETLQKLAKGMGMKLELRFVPLTET